MTRATTRVKAKDPSTGGAHLMVVALAGVVCLGPSWGCGRMLLGVAPGTGDGAADGPPSRPAAVVGWEPRSADPSAHITAARVGADFTYVGFSNGEIYYRPTDAIAGTTGAPTADAGSWKRMDLTQNIGGQLTPRMAVTAIAIDALESSPSVMVGYAGQSGAHTFWCAASNGKFWLELPLIDDVWAVSVSPFDASAVVVVTRSLTQTTVGCGSSWGTSAPGSFAINFAGTVEAFAEGVGPGAARRAWLGDALGGVYYADAPDVDAATSPASLVWAAVPDPGFPQQPVTAIAVDRDHPERLWVTFRGLSPNDVWSTADNGVTWKNQRRAFLATPSPVAAGSLTAVSLIPSLDLAYVTALSTETGGTTAATSFWTVGDAQPWSPEAIDAQGGRP